MSQREVRDELREHEFDGIKEYDNPLPRWWVWLFWATIIATPVYIVYYHFGPGKLVADEYQEELDAYYEQQRQQLLALGEVSEVVLRKMMENPAMLSAGEKIFIAKCVQCHARDGGGNIGPNLTDDYWLHGGNLMDIHRTIHDGVPTKGMIAWGNQLSEVDIMAVTAYVGSLRGTTPANPKPPQGELFVRQPLPEDGDAPGGEAGGEAVPDAAEARPAA
ncbi:MAG: cbb3-type cytochrome c oxidase N-terminal domain-containing protein [Acidobacteriota bacterium]|nr:MAG: hypothetical protein D6738_05810 [Acidobacteriota bacterium]